MNRRGIISFLLLTLYVIATGANSLDILSCDCAAHHRHDLCCGEHQGDDCDGCCGHNHFQCAAFCDTEGLAAGFMQHCSCTHSHSGTADMTVAPDTDELLKYIKLFAGDSVPAFDSGAGSECVATAVVVRCRDNIPIAVPPVICAGAPRAPSFLA